MPTPNTFESDIDTGLPNTPLIQDTKLREEFQKVYSAIQVLQIELSAAKLRIAELENP